MKINAESEICMKTKLAAAKPVCLAARNLRRDLLKCCGRQRTEGSGNAEKDAMAKIRFAGVPGGAEKNAMAKSRFAGVPGGAEKDAAAEIWLADVPGRPEVFRIAASDGHLEIGASDELGFVYGIYWVSREILGIHNFWFWNDQVIEPKECIQVPDDLEFASEPYAVKYRGWFLNDEVLLHTWKVEQKEEKPWEMALEALLRCGGNLVIPGTGRNADKYGPLASDMGLYLTHHHSQPLGAEMFVQAYPSLTPSYGEHAEKFQELWKKGIERQKGRNVIWTLGFRGQGDYPFWVNDPQYQTPEAQGKLISSLLRQQYDMVKAEQPDAVCCTNLYGETMELYQGGWLDIPEDVIKIWADNGFGKMVSRRQENHNPRIPSLPLAGETGKNGIYYHVSFYDLQAANHITMMPNSPELIRRELEKARECKAAEYWLVNCSNVKPHVYFLDLIAEIWQKGDTDIEEHRRAYVRAYYGENHLEAVADCLKDYSRYALAYGPNEDDHAGEQFSNHVARMLVSQYMRDENQRSGDLLWASSADTLEGQILWYQKLCQKAKEGYREYLLECEQADLALDRESEPVQMSSEPAREPESGQVVSEPARGPESVQMSSEPAWEPESGQVVSEPARELESVQMSSEPAREPESVQMVSEPARRGQGFLLTGRERNPAQTLFRDSLLLQAKLHYHCFSGAYLVCLSLQEAMNKQYQKAFYFAGRAREEYLAADKAMREREHGKWKGFYANECLTDVKQTAWVLKGLMSYIRNLGDGPHFYQWQRDFLYAEEDRKVMLIMNMENHLEDHEIFALMKQNWEG